VTITIHLPPDPSGVVRFVVSPLVEFGWAWHVLVGADHHPGRAQWVADVHAVLPDEVASDLHAWSFAVRAIRSTFMVDPTVVPPAGWKEQLRRLAGLPVDDFATMAVRPLARLRGKPDNVHDPRVRNRVVALARARGSASADIVSLVLRDPPTAQANLVTLVNTCWSLFFRDEWEAARPLLDRELALRSRLSKRDPLRALRGLSPAISVDEKTRTVFVDKMQSKRLDVAGRGLLLVPSTYAEPHIYVADEPGRPVVVHYPVPMVSRSADSRFVQRALTVLAHPARLEICRAIAVEPRSAHEIARLWRFSESTVTKHLSALRAAGLVTSDRVGRFVRYSLNGSAIEALGTDLLEVLRR
jgi:DNA-binding transcriptional ArsR family regulator